MPPQKSSTIPYIIAGIVILVIIGIGVIILMRRGSTTTTTSPTTDTQDSSFTPFGRIPAPVTSSGNSNQHNSTSTDGNAATAPKLRLLSNTPVGGYGASTTASTTIVRWVDRGRGNIYEAHGDNTAVITLSNTVVPKVYNSIWNRNLTAFVGQSLENSSSAVTTVFAELRARVLATASSTASSTKTASAIAKQAPGTSIVVDTLQTPYELKGKNLPSNIVAYALSPKSDKIFMVTNENGRGTGYTATIDGKSVTEIFDTPVTQMTVEWPEDNTIAITTKASAIQNGYMYFVNPKTGVWKKMLGPALGLSARVSHDAKYILSSTGGQGTVSMSIYDVAKKTSVDAVIRTVADKCVWGNWNTSMIYCAVPSQISNGYYPDDWYSGNMTGADKIWQLNASTGEIHQVTSIVDQSDRVIDAFNLGLDSKDEYLYFMNKNDLSLWSFDLVQN